MAKKTKKLVSRMLRCVPAALAALWMAGAPLSAEAALQGSAGNTVIRNTITVAYSDARNNAQTAVTASVDITVNTVAAAPTVLSFAPTPGSTDGTGATQAYTVRIRTNSNGPGAITFNSADGTFSNVAVGTAPSIPGGIFLGATVIDPSDGNSGAKTVANLGTITFVVPNDGGVPLDGATTGGNTGDNVINGLSKAGSGDIVYLTDGASNYYGPFNVTAVTDPAVGAGTTATPGSITLTNNGASIGPFTPAKGWQIVEAKDVTVTVTQGVVPYATANAAASWQTTLTATMGTFFGTGTVTTNAHMGKIVVTKYVRNTITASGTGAPYSPPVFANNFYLAGVNGNPGETLEYLAKIENKGTGDANVVYATDLMPTYSTLVTFPTSYGASPGSATPGIFARASINAGAPADLNTNGSGGAPNANVGYGNSTGIIAGSTMSFYLGNTSANLTGGKLSAGDIAYVIYQVKIN